MGGCWTCAADDSSHRCIHCKNFRDAVATIASPADHMAMFAPPKQRTIQLIRVYCDMSMIGANLSPGENQQFLLECLSHVTTIGRYRIRNADHPGLASMPKICVRNTKICHIRVYI